MARALVVGAGIAGDAVALLLGRAGWQVDVVEIAPALRSGGQTVDLRGTSAQVLADLGLLRACEQRLVPQRGIAWVDADGRRSAQMPVEAFGGRGFVSTRELLRSDLARVLHEAHGEDVTHLFSETVEALEPVGGGEGDGVRASFRHSPAALYDLVVGADGTHSTVRSLVFGPEEDYRRELGLAHAWFTLDETSSTPPLDGWFLVHNAPGSRVVGARPGHPGMQEAGLTFPSPPDGLPHRRQREAQVDLLRRTFTGVGWRAPELLQAASDAGDLAVDTFDQVHVDGFSRGRVVLLGDSAWCASPLSGLGTALALQGARALADALSRHRVHEAPSRQGVAAALSAYETAMRPVARRAQRLPPGRVRSHAPRTPAGIRCTAAVMTAAQRPGVQRLLTRLAGA